MARGIKASERSVEMRKIKEFLAAVKLQMSDCPLVHLMRENKVDMSLSVESR